MLWYFLEWSIEMLLNKHDKPFGTPETLPSFKQRLTNHTEKVMYGLQCTCPFTATLIRIQNCLGAKRDLGLNSVRDNRTPINFSFLFYLNRNLGNLNFFAYFANNSKASTVVLIDLWNDHFSIDLFITLAKSHSISQPAKWESCTWLVSTVCPDRWTVQLCRKWSVPGTSHWQAATTEIVSVYCTVHRLFNSFFFFANAFRLKL